MIKLSSQIKLLPGETSNYYGRFVQEGRIVACRVERVADVPLQHLLESLGIHWGLSRRG